MFLGSTLPGAKLIIAPLHITESEAIKVAFSSITDTVCILVELQPVVKLTKVNLTVYFPVSAEICKAPDEVEVVPSPKSHCHVSAPIDLSENTFSIGKAQLFAIENVA